MSHPRPVFPLIRALAGVVLFFLTGWLLGHATRPSDDVRPNASAIRTSKESPPPRGDVSADVPEKRGTFRSRLSREKALAAMTLEQWRSAWREAARGNNPRGLMRDWAAADPRGALTEALNAARRLPAEDQERYNYEFLGDAAINELFRQDAPAAARAAREWAALYGRYPALDCLHLLVTGDATQKAALRELVSAGDSSPPVLIRSTGMPLEVLEILMESGPPARPGVLESLVTSAVAARPRETAEWLLRRRETFPLPDRLTGLAIEGALSAGYMNSPVENLETLDLLFTAATPELSDQHAASFARLRAEHDPEAARQWALEHVPEASLPGVLKDLDEAASQTYPLSGGVR